MKSIIVKRPLRIILVTFAILYNFYLHGQASDHYMDSVLAKLDTASTYRDSIKIWRNVAWYLLRHDTEQSRQYIEYFQALALSNRDSLNVAAANHYFGLANRLEGNYEDAIHHFKQALHFYESDSRYQESTLGPLFNLGVISQLIADYQNALQYFYRHREIETSLQMPHGQANTLNSIGITYKKMGELAKARETFDEALLQAEHEKDIITQSLILSNRANIKSLYGDYVNAIHDLQLAIRLDSLDGYKVGVAAGYAKLAKNYLAFGDLTKARDYAMACANIQEEINHPASEIEGLLIHAEVLFASHQYDIAMKNASKAYSKSQNLGHHNETGAALKLLAEIQTAAGQWQASVSSWQAYHLHRDTIQESEKLTAAKNLQIRYEVKQREEHLNNLQAENKLNALVISKQKKWQQVLLLCLALTLFIFVLVSRILSLRLLGQKLRTEKENLAKEKAYTAMQAENKVLLMNAMIRGQESERSRIAKDLHDGLGGLLSTVKMHFLNVQREIESLNKIGVYKRATNLLDDACEEVRRIAHNMMPDALSQLGLAAAVEDLAHTLESRGFDVHLSILNLEEKLPEEFSVHAFRIIQELVNNLLRHAQATKVIIQLSKQDQHLQMTVEDNGVGFDVKKVKAGLGLNNIRSRINYFGGTLDVHSKLGEGTSIHVDLPLV